MPDSKPPYGYIEPNHQVLNLIGYEAEKPKFDCPVCEETKPITSSGGSMDGRVLACDVCLAEAFEMLLRSLKKAKVRREFETTRGNQK